MAIDIAAIIFAAVAATAGGGGVGAYIHRQCTSPFHHPDEHIQRDYANDVTNQVATRYNVFDEPGTEPVPEEEWVAGANERVPPVNPLADSRFTRRLAGAALAEYPYIRNGSESNRLVIARFLVTHCKQLRQQGVQIRDWQMAAHIPLAVELFFSRNTTDFIAQALRTCDTQSDFMGAAMNSYAEDRGGLLGTITRWFRRRRIRRAAAAREN